MDGALKAVAVALATVLGVPAAGQEGPWRLSDAVDAPEWLTLGGSVRARYESLSGQPRAGLSVNDQLVSFRSSVIAEARHGRFRLGGELQDARAYDADADGGVSVREVDAFEPLQAYVGAKFDGALGDGSSLDLSAGRFILSLGSRRVVSADEYRNATSGYTGLRADLAIGGGATASFIYVLPQIAQPADLPSLLDNEVALDRESSDLQLYGGVGRLPLGTSGAALEATYLRLEERDRSDLATRDRQLHTTGLRLFREPKAGAFDFDVEGFAQGGEISASTAPTAATQDVDAWFLHAEAGYRWAGGWSPRLALELDHASGDETGGDGDYERFDTLFGMRRAELAPAGIYSAVGRANLSAPGVRLEVAPNPRTEAFVSVKALYLASETDSFSTTGVRDASGAAGDFAGTQVDARLRYWLVPDSVRLEANAVFLAKGRFYDEAPNSPSGEDVQYGSLNVVTTF